MFSIRRVSFHLYYFCSALNEELMSLLVVRDDLQIEQDAKLVDVEDAKTLIGPETTV